MHRKSKSTVCFKIVGLILSESYQRCKMFAQQLYRCHKATFLQPSVKGLLEVDWMEYLDRLRKEVGGQTWAVRSGVVVFKNGIFIGGEDELFHRCKAFFYKNPSAEEIRNLAKVEYLNYLNRNNLLYVYLQLSLSGENMGSLLFQLRSDLLPKTSAWFALLCDPQNPLGCSYKGSRVHRVCKSGWFQAGELDERDCMLFLEDESFCYKHDRRGVLSLANDGKHSNQGQFFVTFNPSEWMDEHYVAFGRLVEGSDVLRRIECTKCTYERPDLEIKIENCGLAEVGLGRSLTTKSKLKGLTVGVPHIHLDTYMDLVFERLEYILLDRLDDGTKRKINKEWMREMIWKVIDFPLSARQPVPDVTDVREKSSLEFLKDLFFAGLYDLRDVADHYIMAMINDIVTTAVEKSDTNNMAGEMLSFILSFVFKVSDLETPSKLSPVESFVTTFTQNWSGHVELSISSDFETPRKLLSKSGSTSTSKRVHFLESVKKEDLKSTKDDVVQYILESLFKSLKSSSVDILN